MTTEIWLPVPIDGMENLYRISSFGRIQSCALRLNEKIGTWHEVKPWSDGFGYLVVTLCSGTKRLAKKINVLVLLAFTGPRPIGHCARHLDGNPKNNSLENLQWATYKINSADRVQHGTEYNGTRHHSAKLTVENVRFIRQSSLSNVKLGKLFGVTKGTIRHARVGLTWKSVDRHQATEHEGG